MAGNASYFATKAAAKTAANSPSTPTFGQPTRQRPPPVSRHLNSQQFNVSKTAGFTMTRGGGATSNVGSGIPGSNLSNHNSFPGSKPNPWNTVPSFGPTHNLSTQFPTSSPVNGPVSSNSGKSSISNAIHSWSDYNAPSGSGKDFSISPKHIKGAIEKLHKSKHAGNNKDVLKAVTGAK